MLNGETIDDFCHRCYSESFTLPEKYQRLVDNDSEWRIFCIEQNEKGGIPPYTYLFLKSTIYSRMMILGHIWHSEHYKSQFEIKVCANCGFKYERCIYNELSPCLRCKAPFNFNPEKIEKWLNGEEE